MRKMLIPLLAAAALAVPSTAMAGDPPTTDGTVPPAFVPPTPAPVTDVATANAAAKRYAASNAGRFLGIENRWRNRVRVTDVNAACLEHPIIAARFGCVFTLRALVINRDRGWDGWGHHGNKGHASKRGGDRRRFRVRTYGCLGALSITGGPTVTPTITLRFVECARAPRGDWDAPEPVL